MASVVNDEIISFYESLIEEKENFALSLKDLLQAKLLTTERRQGGVRGVAGISKGNLFFIVVKKEYQNQKIGQRLLTKVINLARKKRYHYITLNVFASNSIAIHIYQKFGFSIAVTNIMNSKKNYFMILPLDFLGVAYKLLIKIAYKWSLSSIIHRSPKIKTLKIL